MSIPDSADLLSVRVADEQLLLVDRGLNRIVVFDLIRSGNLR